MTTTPVQPMPSARVAPGVYEVIGTSTACRIESERGYKGLGNGTNWHLYSNGQHVRTFETKREALVYCQVHPEL